MSRDVTREVFAEFLGTFVLIVFGVAVVAQTVLSAQSSGSYLAINLGWGLAVTMGCYVAAGVSGRHLGHLSAAVPQHVPGRRDRSGGRDGASRRRDLRHH